MPTVKMVRLDPETFDYKKFKTDLVLAAEQEGLTIYNVSEDILLRSATFLQTVIVKENLPVKIFFALCERFKLKAKDYEIKKEPPKPAPKPATKPAPIYIPLQSGWDSVVRVDENARTVSVRIFHDGAQVTSAMAKIRGTSSDLDIMQSISYAAHMCYKFAEQKTLNARAGG